MLKERKKYQSRFAALAFITPAQCVMVKGLSPSFYNYHIQIGSMGNVLRSELPTL